MYGFRLRERNLGEFRKLMKQIHEMDEYVLGWIASYSLAIFIVFARESDAISLKMRLPSNLLEVLEPLTSDQSNLLISSDVVIKTEFRSFALE